MKSLRSQISFNTVTSIAIISALIITLSIYVYEKLYIEFVSTEVNAIGENISVDLIDYINEPAGSFNQTEVLLRLDEYEYAETAYIFNSQGELLNVYIGQAGLKARAKPNAFESNVDGSQIFKIDTSSKASNALEDVNSITALALGLHHINNKVVMVKTIGEPVYPLGKFILIFNLQEALRDSRERYITLVAPSVVFLICLSLLVSVRAQHKVFRPLNTLIKTMDSVVDDKNYDVKVEETEREETLALSRAFNNMMGNIQAESEANQQKNALLEKQQSQMERLANFDALTGLPNRQFLMKILSSELTKARTNRSELGLLFVDIDGFKSINDSFGHDTGDKFLLHISVIMSKLLDEAYTLGRLGGDEFIIIAPDIGDPKTLEDMAAKLVVAVSRTHIFNTLRLDSGVSVGLALASDCNYELSSLITNADVAMYKAKGSGKARFMWFNEEMLADTKRKVLISTRLSSALENDAFYLAYQAKVDAEQNIIGFETLLRWHDDVLGHVSPAEFIPIAEQTDKISLISMWIIKRLEIEAPRLIKSFGSQIIISINLSPQDLNSERLTQFILKGMRENKLPAKNLEIEITETAYMNNFNVANSFFESIKHYGCQLALDDFGTGYSSLSYLTKFDIDTLKIDRSFVNNIGISEQSELITKTIIKMAKSLNFSVCAEGVETREQAAFLLRNGCHALQGFLYSKPTPLEDVLATSRRRAL
ncbi:diguanylate cyclase/phosphodiesterase [Alteromonas mediterranea MED64]|uniref:EAL domain-containing protein n=1 Tax=Alteromonas mediterranea TaxID=314275 RepID=UPI0003556A01|nr:EAL domain-containing protein [Alteromonas mediterranea]AGP83082.1 diguanylate cyclase/phosphodiesterase [Alteromonas mediterranea MED64]